MTLGLEGKRILVTGGSRGIGRATALALAEAGASLVVTYRDDTTAAAAVADRLRETGTPHRMVRADLTDTDAVAGLARTCREAFGGLDVLVNNAGVHGHAPLGTLDLAEWRRLVDTDLTSMFLVTQACLPLLADSASVINIGASAALRGRAGAAHYTAAKAGVIGLTRSLCKELGPRRGIRVNTVAPGVISAGEADLPPQVEQQVRGMTALGRLGTPADVAGAVLYLAGDLSRYVSGVTLNVDGGM
ncbi:SDR family NAD(P)-dependent oxidoreductase [Streptomyces morookaense]|uniref:SDR family oxidoreductase n=1 Tax=Streptomyces morookaense TaxID=1970 RepID=A0A7Y7B535_STRMO|nr:SDR family oxidoreductase [Streptomyces morookaense]NVK79160.1 SDR family oxidoreductase [Streptomyces morookaense]GHF28087.1 short-chain dehydrogenase [Streptomyces morookaense]